LSRTIRLASGQPHPEFSFSLLYDLPSEDNCITDYPFDIAFDRNGLDVVTDEGPTLGCAQRYIPVSISTDVVIVWSRTVAPVGPSYIQGCKKYLIGRDTNRDTWGNETYLSRYLSLSLSLSLPVGI
jgi:hypothetical protein